MEQGVIPAKSGIQAPGNQLKIILFPSYCETIIFASLKIGDNLKKNEGVLTI